MKKNNPLISVNQLSRFYGKKTAIENVSFDVNHGEILGLLGPNGAGNQQQCKLFVE